MATTARSRLGTATVLGALLASALQLGFTDLTVRYVAWSAVEFFPSDLERHVRRHHRRFEAGLRRGLESPPAWRAGPPGRLPEALVAQARACAEGLQRPVPLEELVEELGVLAVRVLDANDPLAVGHSDAREPSYAGAFESYVDSTRGRVRLVYYGQDEELIYRSDVTGAVQRTLERSRALYPYVGDEFFRTGSLRDWRSFDDRSVAFGVAAVSMSRGLTDLANFGAWVWRQGGGLVPTPRPTPEGHTGPVVMPVPELDGGFPERDRSSTGAPKLPPSKLRLPPP